MNTVTILFGILLCTAAANSRQYNDRVDTEVTSDELDHIGKARDEAANKMRHRRRRWQSSYGYDYPPPPIPYYPDRREYERPNQQQDLLPQILRLLDEISIYAKRPPPPPQPIYVPYPVPYPVPQQCICQAKGTTEKTPTQVTPDVDKRIKPEIEDERQNWGIVDSNTDSEYDDNGDGSRPISFEPIKPKRPMQRPPPDVDHGSSQANNDLQTQASINSKTDTNLPRTSSLAMSDTVLLQPSTTKTSNDRHLMLIMEVAKQITNLQTQASINSKTDTNLPRTSSTCNGAILSCCNHQQQKQCFTRLGCAMTFARGNACTQDSIATAIESFKIAYAPVY
uniref:GMPiso00278 n=1 Tax=Galleria mellonella TaxID=7137 RepID=A0A3G1T1K8_GALME|nr:GMPiso00278 [Galleria mellonella]